MSTNIEEKLKNLGIVLPSAPAPAANYVPYIKTGSTLYVSGQISQNESGFITGKLGLNLSTEEGYQAARYCAILLISQLKLACHGDLNKVENVVRLGGFVNSAPDFLEHPKVINGASDLMVEIFGDKGKHSRAATGASSLPFGVAVEVDGIFEIQK